MASLQEMSEFADLTAGWEMSVTMQLRTPLKWLRRHREFHAGAKRPEEALPLRATLGCGTLFLGLGDHVMRLLSFAIASVLLGGCAAAHQVRDREDYLAEATRIYPGETRERVLKAAETVLKISDPADFEFRYTLTGFTGLRRYFIYAVVASAAGREKWEFLTEPAGEGLRASVSISEEGTASGGYSSNKYEGAMASVPLYRLFWNRVDYMLGRRLDWVTCADAAAELEKSNTNTVALGGLCGPTSDGRNAEPPQPFPPLVRQTTPPKAKRSVPQSAPTG